MLLIVIDILYISMIKLIVVDVNLVCCFKMGVK